MALCFSQLWGILSFEIIVFFSYLWATITERKFNEGSFIWVYCAKLKKHGGPCVSGQCYLTSNDGHVKTVLLCLRNLLWHFCGLCRYGWWESSVERGPGCRTMVLTPHALHLAVRGLQRSLWSDPQWYQCVPVSKHCSQTYLRAHQTAPAPEIPDPAYLSSLPGHHSM